MADEPVETPEPVVEPVVAEVEPVAEVHPLSEGGARFNEVYARMKAAEDRAQRMEGFIQAQQQQHTQQRQPTGPVVFSHQQLQQSVDQGQITPMAAADILASQRSQQNAVAVTVEAERMRTLNDKIIKAGNEVNQFIERIPSLRDNMSAEFQKVATAAYAAADDMGLPVTDVRVQRVALKQVYGSLERVAQQSKDKQVSRDASLPHVESNVGSAGKQVDKGADPLKGVPSEYLEFWKKKGYTRERMIDEAQYVTRAPRKMPVTR